MSREFMIPREIFTGEGALEAAGKRLGQLGRKALIVTDQMMLGLGNVEKLEMVLESQNIASVIYPDINGEPTDLMIRNGLAIYQKKHCDFLVAIGGGSPIDSMKAIAALVSGGSEISSYMGRDINGNLPPMVAIPTTAGTGSEATQFTIITDTQNDVKMLLKGRALIPQAAVIDPQFTLTAPPQITAATGLDALTHAIEAFTSRKAQALSDTFALSAVKRIFRYLPIAYQNGADQKAREEMAIAALEAGIAFNNASVTIVHGMSRPIGAMFHVPHGLSNAMLLKECLEYVLDGAYDRFAELGRTIQAADEADDDKLAGEKFLAATMEICRKLDVQSLAEYGIDMERYTQLIDKMARDAMISGSPQNTRKEIAEADVKKIYQALAVKNY